MLGLEESWRERSWGQAGTGGMEPELSTTGSAQVERREGKTSRPFAGGFGEHRV